MNLFIFTCAFALAAASSVFAYGPCFGVDLGTISNPATSCKNLLRFGSPRASAVYWIQPPGAKKPFQAYCDMETEGGGWMLLYAYKHRGGDNFPVVQDLPTDPDGYSHQLLDAYNISPGWAQELRFFCTSSRHNRVVHFTTRNRNIIQTAYDGKKHFKISDWKSGFTTMPEHGAHLPAATANLWATNSETPGFTDFPFWNAGAYHWGIGPDFEVGRFECDDYPNNHNHDTLHRIWVRE